jgi:DNA-binding phage protein
MKPETAERHRVEFLRKYANVIERRRAGEAVTKIAASLGVSHQRICQILLKAGDPSLLGVQVVHRVPRVRGVCRACGAVLSLLPSQDHRRVCSRACAHKLQKRIQHDRWRCLEVGEAIARRRIAGETWASIAVSHGKKPNELPYFHNNARRYLEHIGAPAETWKIVFPGQSVARTPEWIAKIVATKRARAVA